MLKFYKTSLITLLLSWPFIVHPSLTPKFLPKNILQVEPFFTHHVVVAEKSTHKLYLFENQEGFPVLIKTYKMATGKKRGDKQSQGDHRTPEGIYFFTDFIPKKKLLKRYGKEGQIYGAGAFVMDYPNTVDKIKKKTGGGIWLHSTNDETRIEKGLDSRGCVVVANDDLKEISTYIELNKTSIIVVDRLEYLTKASWLKQRKNMQEMINNWLASWREESLENYINHYSPELFYSPNKGKIQNYKKYKKAVFSSPGRPDITLKNLSIFIQGEYARLIFRQHYKSSRINDTGKKVMFLKRDSQYQWKIISERWRKMPAPSLVQKDNQRPQSFRPTMRFFSPEE